MGFGTTGRTRENSRLVRLTVPRSHICIAVTVEAKERELRQFAKNGQHASSISIFFYFPRCGGRFYFIL